MICIKSLVEIYEHEFTNNNEYKEILSQRTFLYRCWVCEKVTENSLHFRWTEKRCLTCKNQSAKKSRNVITHNQRRDKKFFAKKKKWKKSIKLKSSRSFISSCIIKAMMIDANLLSSCFFNIHENSETRNSRWITQPHLSNSLLSNW